MTWPDVGLLDAVLLFHLQPLKLRLLKASSDKNILDMALARE